MNTRFNVLKGIKCFLDQEGGAGASGGGGSAATIPSTAAPAVTSPAAVPAVTEAKFNPGKLFSPLIAGNW